MIEVEVHALLGEVAIGDGEGFEDGEMFAVGAEEFFGDLEGEGAEADEVVLDAFEHLAEGLVAAVLGAEGVDSLASFEKSAGIVKGFEFLEEGIEGISGDARGGETGGFAFEEAAHGV